MGELALMALNYGSDKVPNCAVYETYLAPYRHQPIKLLEIGVGGYDDPRAGGASLRMWKQYFGTAKIFALDFYDKTPHEEDRIRIFKGSQDDHALLDRIAKEMDGIDVIVDDGSHICAHVIASFEALFPQLRAGGLYIVEDVGTSYWPNHGGSEDVNEPSTSLNYFKRLVDGINSAAMLHPYERSYFDAHTEYIHFYSNFVVVKKKPH